MNDNNDKIRIIPLGGVQEIGMNMTVIEYGNELIIIDCGFMFPRYHMLGIDYVIPDTSYLKDKNIKVIGSYLPQSGADLPAVSAEVYTLFDNKNIIGIVDMGGNSAGSLSFATFRDNVDIEETDIIFILNANREENSTLEFALGHFNSIESTLGLKITGIVNNTHLMNDTTIEDINKGELISSELSKEKNIPVKFTCINKDFIDNNPNLKTKYDLFLIGSDIKTVTNII